MEDFRVNTGFVEINSTRVAETALLLVMFWGFWEWLKWKEETLGRPLKPRRPWRLVLGMDAAELPFRQNSSGQVTLWEATTWQAMRLMCLPEITERCAIVLYLVVPALGDLSQR